MLAELDRLGGMSYLYLSSGRPQARNTAELK